MEVFLNWKNILKRRSIVAGFITLFLGAIHSCGGDEAAITGQDLSQQPIQQFTVRQLQGAQGNVGTGQQLQANWVIGNLSQREILNYSIDYAPAGQSNGAHLRCESPQRQGVTLESATSARFSIYNSSMGVQSGQNLEFVLCVYFSDGQLFNHPPVRLNGQQNPSNPGVVSYAELESQFRANLGAQNLEVDSVVEYISEKIFTRKEIVIALQGDDVVYDRQERKLGLFGRFRTVAQDRRFNPENNFFAKYFSEAHGLIFNQNLGIETVNISLRNGNEQSITGYVVYYYEQDDSFLNRGGNYPVTFAVFAPQLPLFANPLYYGGNGLTRSTLWRDVKRVDSNWIDFDVRAFSEKAATR